MVKLTVHLIRKKKYALTVLYELTYTHNGIECEGIYIMWTILYIVPKMEDGLTFLFSV